MKNVYTRKSQRQTKKLETKKAMANMIKNYKLLKQQYVTANNNNIQVIEVELMNGSTTFVDINTAYALILKYQDWVRSCPTEVADEVS